MLRLKDKVKLRKVYKLFFISVMMSSLFMVSCKDDYYYDDQEPEWLGASIYDYLVENGNYKYYVKLIDDVGYAPVLSRTGSKTLFVVKDDAFERFFQGNDWGVTSYNQFSLAQKTILLKYGMIDNAYIMENLANHNYGSLIYGTAFRRETSVEVLDSVSFEIGDQLPENEFWDDYREQGIYMVKDGSSWPLVYFHPKTLSNLKISDEDFELITGVSREDGDIHVVDKKVIEADITCKNGYVHVLEDVLIPPSNVSEYLRHDESVSEFTRLMERYTAPYPSATLTERYKSSHPEFDGTIYVKEYFTESTGGGMSFYPVEGSIYTSDDIVPDDYLLPYSPSWNSYRRFGASSYFALQAEMASIFAPTNEAMQNYLNNTGSGKAIVERYGGWDNVPDDIIALFLRRHMRESFVNALPSDFVKLRDSENSKIPIEIADVVDSYVGVNGVVYKTNNVYPPDDFESVYGPVLFSAKAKIFNWAIRQEGFRLYLNALESYYSFFVPTDDFFTDYIDPVAYAKDVKGALKFWYNEDDSEVNATIYSYDPVTYPETNGIGDSIGVITNTSFISNRLLDLLDTHIVVDNVESGNKFYKSKGGNTLVVEGSGDNMTVKGGGDIENGTIANVYEYVEQKNGKTYFIDKPIQTPLKSVYQVLNETPEFNEFFKLCAGFSSTSSSAVFVKKTNNYGIDFNVEFLNTFNYTLYVPTNEAIQKAFDDGVLHSWDDINTEPNLALRAEYIVDLERFLRYHFQDNSVFVEDGSYYYEYQSSTIKENDAPSYFNTFRNKYYKIGVESDGNGISLVTETEGTASVVKDNGLYNILARDYIFNDSPSQFEDIGNSNFNSSRITTSSNTVIHQIDAILNFE